MFRVGQKVVCINAGQYNNEVAPWGETEKIIEGEIYTIVHMLPWEDGTSVVHLAEVLRDGLSRLFWGNDVGYAAARFRPLVERKSDISAFTKMLTPTDILEDA